MLTSNAILDAVQQRIHDNSATMRVRLLSWMNDLIQQIYLVRDWSWLETSASLVISSNQGTKPADFGKFLTCYYSTAWYLDHRHQMLQEDAWRLDVASDSTVPTGWTQDASYLYFKPAVTACTATLKYIKVIPAYADNATTLLPNYFRPLMVRSLLDAYYEFEADERTPLSIQLHLGDLAFCEKTENMSKPKPATNYKYIRGYR